MNKNWPNVPVFGGGTSQGEFSVVPKAIRRPNTPTASKPVSKPTAQVRQLPAAKLPPSVAAPVAAGWGLPEIPQVPPMAVATGAYPMEGAYVDMAGNLNLPAVGSLQELASSSPWMVPSGVNVAGFTPPALAGIALSAPDMSATGVTSTNSGMPLGGYPPQGNFPLWGGVKQAGAAVSDFLSPGTNAAQGVFGNLRSGLSKLIPSGFLDKTDPVTGAVKEQGWGMPAIYGLGTLGGLWQANKTYDLNKQQLAFQKDAFYANMENQRKLTNAELEHRQQARLGSGASKESVDSYMKRFGV